VLVIFEEFTPTLSNTCSRTRTSPGFGLCKGTSRRRRSRVDSFLKHSPGHRKLCDSRSPSPGRHLTHTRINKPDTRTRPPHQRAIQMYVRVQNEVLRFTRRQIRTKHQREKGRAKVTASRDRGGLLGGWTGGGSGGVRGATRRRRGGSPGK
jgi:hypothetical protein